MKNYEAKQGIIDGCTAYAYLFDLTAAAIDLQYYADLLKENVKDDEFTKIFDALKKAIADARVFDIQGNFYKEDGKNVFPGGDFSVGINLFSYTESDYQKYKANYKATAFDQATTWSNWLIPTPWDDDDEE